MHWTERARAVVNIGLALQGRGWQLYGFHEDQSDSMTDYYNPASWKGIAAKDGYVVVVDVSADSHYTLELSGQNQEITRSVRGEDCPHCGGSGLEPDGWTLEAAQADPRGFNLDRARRIGGGTPLFPDVISPHQFAGNHERCHRCHGAGHLQKTEVDRVIAWPTFQANPPRKLWHVEKDGRILDGGIGLKACAAYDRARREAAIGRIVDRIEAALAAPTDGAAEKAAANGATIRRNHKMNGIEVVFPAKPSQEIRDGLKRLRFRWSRRQGLWYARYSDALWKQVHGLLQSDAAATEQSPEEGIRINGVTFRCETKHGQKFYYHVQRAGKVVWQWQAIQFQPGQEWFGVVTSDRSNKQGGSIGSRPLTTVTRYDTYEERNPLYGQADPGDVDPPLRLLTAMAELIAAGVDPFAMPDTRVELKEGSNRHDQA